MNELIHKEMRMVKEKSGQHVFFPMHFSQFKILLASSSKKIKFLLQIIKILSTTTMHIHWIYALHLYRGLRNQTSCIN